MCQARMPSQSPSLGAWANVQGQGMVQLQTSNQSPARCHCGTSDITPPLLKKGRMAKDGVVGKRARHIRVARMRSSLLDWHPRSGRNLPWRRTRDPYAILVSEVMLQQTQVARVVPRYLAWLERWPTVEALAAGPAADVIREWQGLGYYRRALNLHRAAGRIAAAGWPGDLTEL